MTHPEIVRRGKMPERFNRRGNRAAAGRTAHDYAIAVAYDGERTEDDYFRGWRLVIPPSRLTLTPIFVKSGGDPLKAVEQAAKQFRGLKDVAEYWCVCDRDDADEEKVKLAWEKADRDGIRLCLSTRSFEVWLALHFSRSEKPIMNEREAIDLVRTHLPTYDVGNKIAPFASLLPRTPTALENAAWLASRNHENPNTNVHGLVRKLHGNLK